MEEHHQEQMHGMHGGKLKRVGSRAQVWHGNAKQTSGGLKKKDLKKNKWGRIVSRKQSERAKKENRLGKAGYTAVKGKFGARKDGKTVKRKSKRSKRRSTSKRSKSKK